jgi:hypothetical protein
MTALGTRPMRGRRVGTLGASAAIGFALLAVLALLPTGAVASPVLSAAPNTSWAYGGGTNVSLEVTTNHTTYAVRGWFAYHVILTQTNTSSSNFTLQVDRTLGFSYVATGTYCPTSCLSGHITANITVRAREHDVGFANFTRSGSVRADGVPVPAIALVNSSLSTDERYFESANYTATFPLRTYSSQSNLSVSVSTATFVALAPALGLVPLNLTTGESWSSQSEFTAQCSAVGAVSYHHTMWNGTTVSGGSTFEPTLNGSGTVGVSGTDAGTVVLRDGSHVPVIALAMEGPFAPREGFLLVPSGSDLFGDGMGAFRGDAAGTAASATETVDWAPGAAGPHAGFLASASDLMPQPDGPAQSGMHPSTGILPAATPSAAPGSGVAVQAQPETVPAAQAGSQCILSGGSSACIPGSGTSSPSGPGPHGGLLGDLIVVGAVVVLGALLAGLVVARRRVPPPPPSASPPYPPAGTRPSAPRAGISTEPGTEPDPLGHLW